MSKNLIEEVSQLTISQDNLEQAAKELWNFLSSYLDYLNLDDLALVELAFEQMVSSHDQQRRKNGDFYIIHPTSACAILSELKIGAKTLAACLLHDVPEDTETTLEDLAQKFDPEIVFLVEGVTKLSVIKYQGVVRHAENLRKMFVAMSQDVRVVFIKMADRIHNLMTLKHVREDKQKRIALESIEIYATIAERLGVGVFKTLLQELAFPFVEPEEYKKLISISELEINKRSKQLEKISNKVKSILEENQISGFKLEGRAKKYFSIYHKMHGANQNANKKNISEIYDLIALRVIVDKVDQCYQILSILHLHFTPLLNRIKDYIVKPKSNGYQSLHTAVRDIHSGLVFEFQIRTYQMHEYAEYGWASHWSYKQKSRENKFLDPINLKWINELVELGQQDISQEEYLEKVKLHLFEDRIFVLTPKNDVINLPIDSTPLDFAFHIHEEIGLHAKLAKVNGEVKKLNHTLNNGDVVEIQISKNQKPSLHWIDWAKSRNTKRHLRHYFRKNSAAEQK